MNKSKKLNEWLKDLDEIKEDYHQIEHVTEFKENVFYYSHKCENIVDITKILNNIFKNNWVKIGNDKPQKVIDIFYHNRSIQGRLERIIVHPNEDARIETQKRLFTKRLIEDAPIVRAVENIQFKREVIKDIEFQI